jgi:hypothetical protein
VFDIVLPDRFDASRAQRLLGAARALTAEASARLDARAVRFAQPFGLTTIGAALLRRAAHGHGPPAYRKPEDPEVDAFLREVGFHALVLAEPAFSAGATLPMKRLASGSLDPVYTNQVAKLIERAVPNTSESVTHLVETALNELLQNVVEHAQSSTDVVLLTRWYARDANVRIAIADSGIGIAESLRKNPAIPDLPDTELVRRAVEVEGTTGRVSKRFGGLGLKRLRDLCIRRGGSVHVLSRTVDAHFAVEDTRTTFVPRLDGTSIEIDFRPGPDDGSRADDKPEEFF